MVDVTLTAEELRAALPDVSTPLRLKGPEGRVRVYRDAFGIPHVRAQSTHDAFFGQGFVTAQDRLWQMEYDRRRAYGRWAEFAGPEALEQDAAMRRFQLLPSVQNDYAAVNAETRAMLDAYAAGVNAFVGSTQALPVEYRLVGGRPETWQPWDCLAVFKVRHLLMGTFESKLWRARLVRELGPEKAARLLPGYEPGHLVIVPPGAAFEGPAVDALQELQRVSDAVSWMDVLDSGSNNWALAGNRTSSGKPLLAGDPHRPLDTPNVYYQNHIACGGFDVAGLSFPGCPGFPHFGHNAHVAWCVTHAAADYQDLYVERFREDDPSSYEFQGEWQQAEVRHETIRVRGGPALEQNVTVTRHGPVIAGDPGKGYGIAFQYTATAAPNTGFDALLPMLRSGDADEMEEAMRPWVDPCNNLVFADRRGNIGYLTRGKVPIRSMANAWLPVPGWTGEYEWQGAIPFAEMPRSRNPETGYIITANNRITEADYPYYINVDFAPDFRARRIADRLAPLRGANVNDMVAMHAERVSMPGRSFARLLEQVETGDDLSAEARRRLVSWDGSMDREAVEPTVFAAFRDRLDRLVIGPLLGSLAEEAFNSTGRGAPAHVARLSALLVQAAQENETWMLPAGQDWKSVLAQALAEGVDYLRQRLGDDMEMWQWGRVHATRPRHTLAAVFPELEDLLDPPATPMSGSGDTPHAAGYSPGDLFTVTGLSVARYAFDLADWGNSRWIIPLGASGHPGSPHYADQAPVWSDIQTIPMLYDWDKVGAQAETYQELGPEEA